jgi:hypothetical protein
MLEKIKGLQANWLTQMGGLVSIWGRIHRRNHRCKGLLCNTHGTRDRVFKMI